MSVLFLSNTVPMYFIEFRNDETAHRFGTELKLYGDMNDIQYRFKVLNSPNDILTKMTYNSFRVEEMPKDLYNEIIREIRASDLRRHYRRLF